MFSQRGKTNVKYSSQKPKSHDSMSAPTLECIEITTLDVSIASGSVFTYSNLTNLTGW